MGLLIWDDAVCHRGEMGDAVVTGVVVVDVVVVVIGVEGVVGVVVVVGEGEMMFYPVLSCYLIFVQVIEYSNER
jgi:hypothetical protein